MPQPDDMKSSSPNKLLGLFSTLLKAVLTVLLLIWTPFKWVLRQVFGNIAWQAPAWASWTGRNVRAGAAAACRQPRRSLAALLCLLLLAGGGW